MLRWLEDATLDGCGGFEVSLRFASEFGVSQLGVLGCDHGRVESVDSIPTIVSSKYMNYHFDEATFN